MQCCVSFCRNTSHNVSTSEGQGKDISFHDFPSEAHLRAAWLRALGKDDSSLTDPAVVCSQHFLYDDIYETQSGLRQIVTGAIPLTVQVCMICLDTDCKLILMSKHKLEKVYEKLTGHPMCDKGNLKKTLCLQCAQRLINFSSFRYKSLTARALMIDLVRKYQLTKRRQKKIINCAKHQQKSNMVLTTLGLNSSDLRILEHPTENRQIQKPRKEEENRQTELEETLQRVVVKTEESDVSMVVDGDTEVKHEHNNDKDCVWDPLKYERITFQCTLCMEEFAHENAYIEHVCVYLKQNGEGDGECDTSQVCKPHTAVSSSSSHSSLHTENKVLGKQDSHLPDSAVVCSQETQSVLRQIITGAIPSKVQVCMICLDTDSKLILMSDHKLEKAYEKLTGHPSCDLGKLKQTLCLQCAQRLINFSLFRDKSLRARAQIMGLVEKHELITRRHLKKIRRAKLKRTRVLKMVGLNNCDLDILEHPLENRQIQKLRKEEEENRHTELEETGQRVVVKTEESDVSMLVDGDTKVLQEHNNDKDCVWDSLKYESITYQCTLCMEEFVHENAYIQHVCVHLQNGEGDGECDTSQVCKPHTAVSSSSSHSSLITENKSEDFSYQATSQNEAPTTEYIEPVTNSTSIVKEVVLKTSQSNSSNNVNILCIDSALSSSHTDTILFICDICGKKYKRKSSLVEHIKTHIQVRQVSCKICSYKCKYQRQLTHHMRTHTGEKPYACELCEYTCAQKRYLVIHMRIHTGERPFCCNICEHKCTQKSSLMKHIRIHTGKKQFTCNICNRKFARSSNFVIHMRTHTSINRTRVRCARVNVHGKTI